MHGSASSCGRPWIVSLAGLLILLLSACSAGAAPTESTTENVETEAPVVLPTAGPSLAPISSQDQGDNGNGRPAKLDLTLSGTKTQSDGTYSASGPARLCGDAVLDFTGNRNAFQFEFPLDGTYQIDDVTFSADDLLPGAITSVFHIGVNVTTANGGQPPATVVGTDLDGSGDTGTAKRTESNGTTTLVVDGTDDVGQTIHLTATCGPK